MPNSDETLTRLAVIEHKLETNSQSWLNPVRRIEEAVNRVEKQLIGELVELKDEQKKQRRDHDALKEQVTAWKIRLTTGIAIVTTFWVIFGGVVEDWLKRVLV